MIEDFRSIRTLEGLCPADPVINRFLKRVNCWGAGTTAVVASGSVSAATAATVAAGSAAAAASSAAALAGIQSTIFTALSVGTSLFGTLLQGNAAAGQARFQAQVARNNQIIAQRRADDALTRGRIVAGENDLQTRLRIGRERTIFATTGQEVDVGSALDITSDTAALGKLNSLRILNNAEREAAGFAGQASNFASEATLQDATRRNAIIGSGTQAFGTLLTSRSGLVSQKWHRFN